MSPRNAQFVCDLLYSVLKREEEDIHQIGVGEPRIDHFLCSVAFAPELAVEYLLRKEALRRRIPVECQRNVNGSIVDFFFADDGVGALCELKGPRGAWRNRGPLKKDLRKLLNLSDPSSARRYNGWILVAENESTLDLKQWVRETAAGVVEIDEYAESLPIPVNQTDGKVTEWLGKPYRFLSVVVFSLRH